MLLNIHPFELRHRHLPTKKGLLLEKDGRFSEVSPLPGRSIETLDEAIEQLMAVQKGWRGPLYPSVQFGLYGLTSPPVESIPCALFLHGTPDEVIKAANMPHGAATAKLKVGHWTVEQAFAVIRSIPLKLRLDFNLLWNEKDVHRLCSKLSPDQVEFLEDPGCIVPGFMEAYDEKLSSISLNIWKPMVRGLPPPKSRVILGSSLESSIGLHQIASLMQSHQIPEHVLGIGTGINLEQDIVKNSAIFKNGRLHFPKEWQLC